MADPVAPSADVPRRPGREGHRRAAGPQPDYVVVAARPPPTTSSDCALAEAGVHALIEKPLAPDCRGRARLTDAFDARGLVAASATSSATTLPCRACARRLANGDLGEIYQVVTRRQGPFPGRIADVGVVYDLATHDIDLTAWVTGQ